MSSLKVRAEAQYKGRFKMSFWMIFYLKTIFIIIVLLNTVSCETQNTNSDINTASATVSQPINNNNKSHNEALLNEPHNSAQTGDNGEYDPKNHYDNADTNYDHNTGNGNTDYDTHHYTNNNNNNNNNHNQQFNVNSGSNPFTSFTGGVNNLNSAYLNARQFSANSNAKSRLSNRIIQTRYGKLQGVIVPMDEHKFLKPVEVFLGVPYATPPVGSNR